MIAGDSNPVLPDPHVLVVDDDSRLRALIARYLSENGFRVTAAAAADEARAQLKSFDFDLLVLDVMMPGESGLELTESLRLESAVPILLLTAMDGADARVTGLERGADDYLVKPFEPRELVLRLRSILRRTGRQAESVGVSFGEFFFDLDRVELRRGSEPVHLTSAESALLTVFARHPGATLSRDHLLARCGGSSTRSIDVQITRLRRKIEPDPRVPRYLRTSWGEGYVLRAD